MTGPRPFALAACLMLLTALLPAAGGIQPGPVEAQGGAPQPAPYFFKRPSPVLTETGYPTTFFSTGFSGTALDPSLYWVREDAANWSLTQNPGALSITTQQGDMFGEGFTAHNILLKAVNQAAELRTKITFNPTKPNQQAGLLLFQSPDTYVKLVRIHETPTRLNPQADRVQMLYINNNEIKAAGEITTTATSFYLRLSRNGARSDGFFSTDNVNWTRVATLLDLVLVNTNFGFYAVNGNDNPGTGPVAQFDFFRLDSLESAAFDHFGVSQPSVIKDGGTYKMWYSGQDEADASTYLKFGYATSPDGVNWTKSASNPVFQGEPSQSDIYVSNPTVIKDGSKYWMWYAGYRVVNNRRLGEIYLASSDDGINWTRENVDRNGNVQPVLNVGTPQTWEDLDVRPGRVIKIGNTYSMWYTGRSQDGSAGIGYATSTNGLIWNKAGTNPVITNASAPRGVITDGTTYQVFFERNGQISAATTSDPAVIPANSIVSVLGPGPAGAFDENIVTDPWTLSDGGGIKLYYTGGNLRRIGLAQSSGALYKVWLPSTEQNTRPGASPGSAASAPQ